LDGAGIDDAPRLRKDVKLLMNPWLLLWRKRGLLLRTTMNDIRARNAGSLMGFAWVVIYPLLLLGCYAAVYLYVYNVRFQLFSSNEYVAVIFCGLIPFLGFAEALGAGVPSVTGNSGLVKNTMFPIELVPVKAVLMGQATQLVGLFLLLVATGALGKLSVWSLMVPAIWVMQILFTIGVVWILSSLNVYVRDLQSVVSVIVLMLMMISPIAYPVEAVPAGLRPFWR
jgi:lipopolysaccharide transport system permease protein